VNPQRSRVRGSQLKIVDDHKTIEKVPSQAQKSQSNKDKLRENLRQRPTTTQTTTATPDTTAPQTERIRKTTSAQATRRSAATTKATTERSEQQLPKSRYTPITR
jgi:hypothetical protein